MTSKAKTQVEKFREVARSLQADEDEGRFNAALKSVAKHKPPQPKTKKSPKSRGKSSR